MLIVRYTAWDGSQQIRLTAEQAFDKLSEFLSFTDDVPQALDWLLHQGLEWEQGVRIMGLDELLERVREAMRQRYQEVNLRRAFAELRERLEALLDLERDALEGDPDGERAREAPCDDPAARAGLEALLDDLDDIRDLEDFQRRYGDLFHGPQSLSYTEAVALMREMERWRRLEEQLLSGDLDAVDLENLRALLGVDARRSFEALKGIMTILLDDGLLTQRDGRLRLSPRGVRKIGQLALRDIYQGLLRDRRGGHQTDHRGIAHRRPEDTKPYRYGDPLDLDLVATLKQALRRRVGTPLDLRPDDFEVHATDHVTATSTVLLLDMSWSMSWEGRFAAAKKVAMAMESLIRARYPRDYFAIVGFFTRAIELKLRDLPEASWNMGDPFTNLQDGLRLAAELLARHPSHNQHIIVITDGQPTAYYLNRRLYCEWPLSFGGISMRAAQETLREVERVTRRGITINTFMLDERAQARAVVEHEGVDRDSPA